MAIERLHKVMANAGIASRRECEAMIAAGRVAVNGKIVTEMGVKVDSERDQIRVDGEPIKARVRSKSVYLMLYKPAGYLSVFGDDRGRPGLEALVTSDTRLYPVGRLDADSEGLQLLTNDGELTLRLSHPRYEHTKTYLVLVDRIPSTETLAHFRRGIELEDGKTLPSEWRVLEKPPHVAPPTDPTQAQGVWLQVTLREGRKRQIRRMAAAERLGVRRLIRIGMGPLRLDRNLRPGQSRPLTGEELRLLTAPASDRTSRAPRRTAIDRSSEPGHRSQSAQGHGPSRSRPAPDRAGGPGRPPDRAGGSSRPPDRAGGPGRPPDRAGGSSRARPATDRSDESGRRQHAPDRAASAGQRPAGGRDAGPGRRPPGEGERARNRRGGPTSIGPGPGSHRPTETAERPASGRQETKRGERRGPAVAGDRPARSQSPLRFQKPTKAGARSNSGRSTGADRGARSRPRTQASASAGRRPQGAQQKPPSGGPPKKRKP